MSDEYFDADELDKAAEQNEFIINPIFEPLFDDYVDQPKYYQVYGGRGSGKSTAAAVAMVELTYSEYDHKIMYIRQTMTSIEDSSIEDIRTAIKDLGLQADFKENKGKIINKVTGNTISFKGIRSQGSASAKLKSLSGVTTVVFEEAEEIESFEEWSKIDEGIRKKGVPLKVIMLYNPGSALSSWIHKEWFIDGQPNEDRFSDTVYLHSTYLDNLDNLNEKTIEQYERLKRTNPTYYKNTILAEWTLEASNRIYPDWEHCYGELEERGDEWYSIDWGYGGKDSTAVVKINWIDGKYYVKTVFEEPKLTIRSTLTKMRKGGVPFNAKIYADHMPVLIEEIRLGGYAGIRKCKKGSVKEGVKKVQDKDIVIVGGTTDPIYYHSMTWQEQKGQLKDHEPDALASMRYGIISHRPDKYAKKPPARPARRKYSKGGYEGGPKTNFAGGNKSKGFI